MKTKIGLIILGIALAASLAGNTWLYRMNARNAAALATAENGIADLRQAVGDYQAKSAANFADMKAEAERLADALTKMENLHKADERVIAAQERLIAVLKAPAPASAQYQSARPVAVTRPTTQR